MTKELNTIIIGGGVAGMTAALYLKRAGKEVVIYEKEAPGGQITRTATIENYPGMKQIEGPELAFQMYEQLTSLGVEFIFEEVTSIEKKDETFIIKTSKGEAVSKNVILTLGRNPKKLGIKNEQKLSGKGISWCAICDGPLYRNKEVAVIGGGRAALEEAIYLSKMCSKVTLIHRRNEFRTEDTLVEQVKSTPNIELLVPNQVIEFVEQEERLKKLILEDKTEILVDGCFEFVGQEPSTNICKKLDILDQDGYIKVNQNFETEIKNLYAGGDCIKKNLYQIVTACADGAIIAEEILKKEK